MGRSSFERKAPLPGFRGHAGLVSSLWAKVSLGALSLIDFGYFHPHADAWLEQSISLVLTVGPRRPFQIHAYLKDEGVELASNQIQYSLLSRSVGDEVKEVCNELGRPQT